MTVSNLHPEHLADLRTSGLADEAIRVHEIKGLKMAKSERPEPIFIANRVEQEFDLIFYGGQFWYYNEGCYRPAEMEIREFLQTVLGKDFSSHFVKEVFYVLESRCFKKAIASDPGFINLRNGVYDWINAKLYPHSEMPDKRFIYQLPVSFNPKAKTPRIEKFLSEVVRPEDKKALLQFVGYCLIPTTRFEKAMMLLGEGANGKSTLIKILISLLGKDNVSTLSLHDLSHRFRLADLVGKLLNVFPDLPYRRLQDTANFKGLVSGDPITAERKYQRPFTFENFARLVFSTNKLPPTLDVSPAFFRRWLLIEFPNSFYGKDRDPGLLSRLTTREELEGFLLMAIEGLNSLYEAEEFTESQDMKDLRTEYERTSNPVNAFLEEQCQVDADAEIENAELFTAFRRYMFKEKLPSIGRNDFYKELKKIVPSLVEVRDSSRRYRGIKVIS
ncbi:MAG: hypothetical protein A3G93_08450 [Nitrospinae bacterium RIFCSPLOWO2_12_FULL_45_22]|nr:MAG: hypothetical protein A3G93_08450 [Nitrospinae bacterium RIFCSPLOWO2_12_FULL_45_22]